MNATAPKAAFGDYLELTKPRLSLLSVLTTLIGYAAARPPWVPVEFVSLLIGTCLAAGGVAPATGRLMLANRPPLGCVQVQTFGGV